MQELSNIKEFRFPRWKELITMDLYMGQLVTLLNEYLVIFKHFKQAKKVTSTMINNYVKNGIVDAPIKKRYSRKHISRLMVIFVLKDVFTMDEIAKLIKIQIRKYPVEQAYDKFCEEFEYCLRCVYNNESIIEEESAQEVNLLRNTIKAIVFRMNVKININIIEE